MAGRGVMPLRLVLFVVTDRFVDDEAEDLLGEVRVQVGLVRQIFEPRDLLRFARRDRKAEGRVRP